jgi:hypothetical protein
MAAPELKVPSLLFVNTKITRPDIFNEATFINWYSDEHIPEILGKSWVKSALRFKNADPKVDMPYLVLYPVNDFGFTQSDEFQKIPINQQCSFTLHKLSFSSRCKLTEINQKCW